METILTPCATAGHSRLRVFSLYVDFPAAIRAQWANRKIGQLAGPDWLTSTEMWKLDSLAISASIRKMTDGEAARADLLLVAVSLFDHRHHELMEWLKSLAAYPTDRVNPGLLIGLFGDDDDHTSELGWTVNQCLSCASQMNRDFIWHWMGTHATADHSWLKENLESFLARKNNKMEEALEIATPG